MRLVIIESPYAGNVARNVAYAERCVRDCLMRGEAPMASHLLYTRALCDEVIDQRELGITAGLAWLSAAEASVVYEDLGISPGMQRGIDAAMAAGKSIEYRRIGVTP